MKDGRVVMHVQDKMPLQNHLRKVKAIHERDKADGWARTQMPYAQDRKHLNAPMDWPWQWVFQQKNRWKNSKTRKEDQYKQR